MNSLEDSQKRATLEEHILNRKKNIKHQENHSIDDSIGNRNSIRISEDLHFEPVISRVNISSSSEEKHFQPHQKELNNLLADKELQRQQETEDLKHMNNRLKRNVVAGRKTSLEKIFEQQSLQMQENGGIKVLTPGWIERLQKQQRLQKERKLNEEEFYKVHAMIIGKRRILSEEISGDLSTPPPIPQLLPFKESNDTSFQFRMSADLDNVPCQSRKSPEARQDFYLEKETSLADTIILPFRKCHIFKYPE